jgi:small subunit ribosomal protein S18
MCLRGVPAKLPVDNPGSRTVLLTPFSNMSTNEQPASQPERSLTPAEIPFTTPQVMVRYVTDTGKILPRKYTGLCAKHQRRVTKTLKRSRNMLLAQ